LSSVYIEQKTSALDKISSDDRSVPAEQSPNSDIEKNVNVDSIGVEREEVVTSSHNLYVEKKFPDSNDFSATNLNDFLTHFKVGKGESFTHTSLGQPAGSYNIPSEYKSQLLQLLHQKVFVEEIPVHLTEKPPQITQVKVDLDFKFPLETKGRKYTLETITQMIDLYNKAIRDHMEIDDHKLEVFVFERNAPYHTGGNCKDGIHLMYPYLICDVAIQHKIRDYVLGYCKEILSPLETTNSIEDIIDKSIISTNNWLLYGCCKMVEYSFADQ
jgi:hypothetical protein